MAPVDRTDRSTYASAQPGTHESGGAQAVLDSSAGAWPPVTASQAALATLTVLGVAAAFWMAWYFRSVVFALVTAIFLHIAMKPLVEALFRRGVRRRFGIVIVYALLLLVLVGLIVVVAPMLAGQASAFTQKLPDYYRLARNFMLQSDINLFPRLARMLPPAWDLPGVESVLAQTLQSNTATVQSPWVMLGDLGKNLFYAVAIFAMTLYLTLDRDRILYSLLLRLPWTRRDPMRTLVDEIEDKVGAFLRGQFILCSVVGVLSFVAYLLIGLPYAAALGALAFIFEAVPMVGPLLAALAAGLVAATVGPDKLLWVLVASFAIQMAENNVLVPRIMDKAVGVNAIVSILAITAFTLMFGILGALLAIPMAAIIQVLIDRHLFAVGNPTEAEVESLADLDRGGTRSSLDVLRLEAAELVQDVRKQARIADAAGSPEIDAIYDQIEATASDLSAYLSPTAAAESGAAFATPEVSSVK